MKRNFLMGLLGAAALAMVGCGDDGGGDGMCVGHGCEMEVGKSGSFVYVEIVQGQTLDNRVTAFFNSAGENTGGDVEPPVGTCVKIADLPLPEGTVYENMGPTLTLSPNAGGGTDIVVDGRENVVDFRGAPHDYAYLNDPLGPGDWAELGLVADTYYDVLLDGTDEIQGTFENAVHIPPAWDDVSPAFNAPVEITSGSGYTMEWDAWAPDTEPEGFNPYVGRQIEILEFTEDGVGGHLWCLPSNEDTSFTIPQEFVDDFPETGLIVSGITRHHPIDLDNGRVGHFFGTNCKVTLFNVVAP